METYLPIYNNLKKQHKEFLDMWHISGPADSGSLMIKVKDLENKIKELETLCPALLQQTVNADLPAGALDFAKFVDLTEKDVRKIDLYIFRNYANQLLAYAIPEITQKIMDSELLKQNYIDDTLFNAIMFNKDGLADELFIKETLMKDFKTFPYWKRSLVVSSLTISLAGCYDSRKANMLIDFIEANEDFVWQKALVGLLLALIGKDKEFENDTAFVNRLRNLQTHPKVQYGLTKTALAYEKLEENIKFIQNFSYAVRLDTKIEYFEKPAHWFLPFYDDNTVIKESNISEPLKTLLTSSASWTAPIFKFAYCKNYNQFSDWQNYRVIEILEKEKRGLNDVYKYELAILYPATDCMTAVALDSIYEETLYEFYFFYTSFSEQQFQNIFKQINRLEHQPVFNKVTTEKTKSEVKAQQWINMGSAYDDKGDKDKAIECYQKAIEIKPDFHEAFYNMGLAYYYKGDKDKAIECYQKAIEIKPDKHEAFYNMGLAYDDKGDKDKAIECYQKAIEIKPDKHEAFYGMGLAYYYKGDKDKAIECYQKAIEIKPDFHEAFYNMGLAYDDKGDKDKAIECYQKAIEIKPDKHEAFNNMGSAYDDKGDKDKAIECYQKAIEIKPDFQEAFINIGFTHLKFCNLELAEVYLIKSVELGSIDFGNMNLGHVFLAKHNEALALQTYIESIKNFENKEQFFTGFDDDFQYIMQYGITEKQYNELKEKIKLFC